MPPNFSQGDNTMMQNSFLNACHATTILRTRPKFPPGESWAKFFFAIIALLAVHWALGAGTSAQAEQFSGRVLDYQAKSIYHSPETPGYTSWTWIWQLPDGAVQTVFVQATGPVANIKLSYPVLQSTNSGKDWTRVSGDIPVGPGGGGGGMAVLPNGTMVRPVVDYGFKEHLPHGQILTRGRDIGVVQRSTNGGVSWSDTIDVVSPKSCSYFFPTLIKPLRDGRLILFGGLAPSGVADARANLIKTMFISDDQGLTWGSPIALMPASAGVCEESDFVELPNGDLFWIHRAELFDAAGNYLNTTRVKSVAKKTGDTFVPGPVSTLPFPNIGFPCVLLTKTGVLLDLAYNQSHWSDDTGQTWHDLMRDDSTVLRTAYYPRAVQTADGTVIVVSHKGSDNGYGTFDQRINVQTFRLSPNAEPSTGGND